jgi:hypothetical protein
MPTTLVFKLLPLEDILVSESAPKDHAVPGCENISRAELISLVNIQVPGVLRVDASVLGSFGVVPSRRPAEAHLGPAVPHG